MRFRLLTLVACAALAAPSLAAEKRQLPSFSLVSARGLETPARDFTATGHRLWVVVSPADTLSKRLLDAFKGWPAAEWRSGTVFVIQGTPEDAREWIQNTFAADAEQIQWASDEKRATARSLKLTGTPVLLALDATTIEWKVSGVLSDPQTLRSMVAAWLRDPGQKAPAKL
jgi:hypothetical protein